MCQGALIMYQGALVMCQGVLTMRQGALAKRSTLADDSPGLFRRDTFGHFHGDTLGHFCGDAPGGVANAISSAAAVRSQRSGRRVAIWLDDVIIGKGFPPGGAHQVAVALHQIRQQASGVGLPLHQLIDSRRGRPPRRDPTDDARRVFEGLVGMPFAPVGANPGVVDRSSCVILVSFGQPSAAMLLLHDVINLERTRPELREEYVRIEPTLGCYRDTDTNPLCLIVTAKWMVVL
eukprot:1180365-Prorocentrum_minimum.AAC.2